MSENFSILWFRQDLRLSDNPALTYLNKESEKILPIYIFDDHHPGTMLPGETSRWWLYNLLNELNKSLSGNLSVYRGDPIQILHQLTKKI